MTFYDAISRENEKLSHFVKYLLFISRNIKLYIYIYIYSVQISLQITS